ncbi:three component ABC system middle component [Balneola vulgaris]|uniref:three component ABC system middle component n=1 Tax=Balneola vulgaris TaxID=287535 RepID=UPI000370F924|nr:three component ABC system middle component [Balneola vulgaris]
MKDWDVRPPEIRTLFNPAFCGLVLARGIKGYYQETSESMPYSLSLLILPLCLHKRTRDQVLDNNRSYFTKILEAYPEIRVNFAQRTRGLLPYSMEALAFLMKCNSIEVDDNGSIFLNEDGIMKTIKGSQDTQDCQKAAKLIGKKFGKINDKVTIYTSLGVKP